MIRKIFMIVGLIYSPMQLVASHANANAAASDNASAVAAPAVGAEADVKRGATTSVVTEAERKKGYSYNTKEKDRICTLLTKSSFAEFQAALDSREIIPTQWIHNASILHCALAWSAPVEKVTLLLDRGADINGPNEYGMPPLFALFQEPNPSAKNLRLLYIRGANFAQNSFAIAQDSRGEERESKDSVLHCLCLSTNTSGPKFIETCIVLGAHLEAQTNNWGGVDNQTPLWKAMYLFEPQTMENCRSIEAFVGCGADVTHVEDWIRCVQPHSNQQNYESMVRAKLKRGEEIFMGKQLPLVRGELQAAFANYPNGQPFGAGLASIINSYAGRLLLPQRVYTDAEKLQALDELVAFQEAGEKREACVQQTAQPTEQPK